MPEELKKELHEKLRNEAVKYRLEKLSRIEQLYNEKKQELEAKYKEVIEEFERSLSR